MTEAQTGSRWPRILLKLSGEGFAGDEGYGIDGKVVEQLASEIVEVRAEFGVEMAVVVGGYCLEDGVCAHVHQQNG